MQRHWNHFPHDADMGVRGVGASMEEAFEEAATALCALTADLDSVSEGQAITLRCEASDVEILLVDWLNALVSEMAVRNMVFRRFEVQIEGGSLRGVAWGEARDARRHAPGVEVKGATFTELRVAKESHGEWVAQCVVDV